NGDPSQLERSSKRQLLHRLKKIEAEDPYFRRSDFWRRFSAAGFFAYAVLANGDPSQLERSSKRQLLHRLKKIEAEDPYFRRS
ncbi:hypothetical protein CQA09_29310, partial [Klebsiella pneumoniae]